MKTMDMMKNEKSMMNILDLFVNWDWLKYQILFPPEVPNVEVNFCIHHIPTNSILKMINKQSKRVILGCQIHSKS